MSFLFGDQKATQDVKSTTEPWGPAQPLLKDVLGTAQKYGQGLLNQWYGGNTFNWGNPNLPGYGRVAGLNPYQTSSAAGLYNTFGTPQSNGLYGPFTSAGYSPLMSFMNGTTGQNAINSAMQTANQNVLQPAIGPNNNLDQLTTGIKWASSTPSGVFSTAAGQMLSPETNQYLKGAYDAANRTMTDAYKNATGATGLAGTANQSGAYGGSAWALRQAEADKNLGKQQSDLANTMYSNAYNQERQNQLNAQQIINSMYGTESGRQLGLLGMLNNAYQTGNQQKLGALSLLPGFDTSTAKNLGYGLSAGDLIQNQMQKEIDASMGGYNQGIYNPIDLMSAFANLGNLGGQQGRSSTMQQPYYTPSIASQIMGNTANAAGLYNILKGTGIFGAGSSAVEPLLADAITAIF